MLGVALAYGGLAQLLAGMWEFRTGNTFGAAAFTSFGAFWLSFWAFVVFYAGDIPAADAGHAVGLYLIAWGIFTLYMFVASLRTTGAVATVFASADDHVLPARHRRCRSAHGHHQGGRLFRARDGCGGVVRIVRGGHQLDLRAYGTARKAVERVSGGV